LITGHPKGQLQSKYEQNGKAKQTNRQKQKTKEVQLHHLDTKNNSINKDYNDDDDDNNNNNIKVKLTLCFVNYVPRHEDMRDNGGMTSRILNLCPT
jgi:hypothetical protein